MNLTPARSLRGSCLSDCLAQSASTAGAKEEAPVWHDAQTVTGREAITEKFTAIAEHVPAIGLELSRDVGDLLEAFRANDHSLGLGNRQRVVERLALPQRLTVPSRD